MISAKTRAPIWKTSIDCIKLAFQRYRTENKFLKQKIDELQLLQLKKSSMEVSAEVGDDMVTILSGADQSKILLLMKFF